MKFQIGDVVELVADAPLFRNVSPGKCYTVVRLSINTPPKDGVYVLGDLGDEVFYYSKTFQLSEPED